MSRTTIRYQGTEYEQRRAAEVDRLCQTLCERLLTNSLPPDDAYWWTRIAIEEAAAVLAQSLASERAPCVAA